MNASTRQYLISATLAILAIGLLQVACQGPINIEDTIIDSPGKLPDPTLVHTPSPRPKL
jgi:hypothetical protein